MGDMMMDSWFVGVSTDGCVGGCVNGWIDVRFH